jgi:hypothetical protein
MARDPVSESSSLSSALRTFRRPWPILLAGLACTVLGLVLSQTPLVPLRLLLLGAGVLLAGIAVARRLQTASWDVLEDRAESAGLLAVSAFVALLAYLAMARGWDSGRIFLGALIALALVASGIVLLPRTGRRVAAVVLVLLHFGAIVTSVTAVPPRNEPAPWLSMQLWTHFYRPYVMFAYLTNAYHFYSPDPGPPTLLWFHVEFADGSARWIKIPNRQESPIGLHHQRMLAAAESAFNPIVGPPMMAEQIRAWESKFQRKYELFPGIPHDSAEEIGKRRQIGGDLHLFVDPQDNRPAPLYVVADELPPLINQYSEPQDIAKRLLASYARHIAHTSPDSRNSNNPVQAVRIYRVIHTLISPRELNEGKDPLDPTTFIPTYMGKYDTEGRLLDPKDPFLFWHVPIIRVPISYPDRNTGSMPEVGKVMVRYSPDNAGEASKTIDFVEIHATQSDKFQQETPDE